jgi:chromosomal replication initiation ATPase DnaA
LISIKELTAPKLDDPSRNEPIENRPQTPFSSDELKIIWKKFAYKMKNEGNDTMYLAMIKRDPKIGSNFQLIHEVDNQVQIDYIQTHLSDLIDFLRESLKNWLISINFSISENQEESLKHQTGKDKFNALARKNPNLHTFQKTFNLDIEY